MMDRASCVEFIEQTYFGSVRNGDIGAIMACFDSEAKVIIRHGDNPERFFSVQPSGAATNLLDFYQHICGNYDARFGDFQHFIDIDEQRAASHFKVRLTPKPEGLYAEAGVQELLNCNFFEFNDGLIGHMIIYYANPQGDAATGSAKTPTGYPRD